MQLRVIFVGWFRLLRFFDIFFVGVFCFNGEELGMDEVEKKCGEVLDVLYVVNVCIDEYIYFDVCLSMVCDMVMVYVVLNYWWCEGCCSKGLIKMMIDFFVFCMDDCCIGCCQYIELNVFYVWVKIVDIVKVFRGDYIVVDEYVFLIGIGYVYVQI